MRVSYTPDGEDIRLIRALGGLAGGAQTPIVYAEVGNAHPRHLSMTSALHAEGWLGLLVEPNPELAALLRRDRPGDLVVEPPICGEDADPPNGPFQMLDQSLRVLGESAASTNLHALLISAEGQGAAERASHQWEGTRPWVVCVKTERKGTGDEKHWRTSLIEAGYQAILDDGVNEWFVAQEHLDEPISLPQGSSELSTLAEVLAAPLDDPRFEEDIWVGRDQFQSQLKDGQNDVRLTGIREAREALPKGHSALDAELRAGSFRPGDEIDTPGHGWASALRANRWGRYVVHLGQQARRRLPPRVTRSLIRQRHIRHVTINMSHLTPPSFLQATEAPEPGWRAATLGPSRGNEHRPPIPPGLDVHTFLTSDADEARKWLSAHSFDSDEQLDSRMDNLDDEVGRVRAALLTRLRLWELGDTKQALGNRVAVDVRALQTAAFGQRGIGRFARVVLLAVRETVGDSNVTLIVDHALRQLPADLQGECHSVTRIDPGDVESFSVLIQPSPMTHSPAPFIPLLRSEASCLAVVFDFIPLHYPNIYMGDVASRLEYAARLDALKLYSSFVCISKTVESELLALLGLSEAPDENEVSCVAWPSELLKAQEPLSPESQQSSDGPIVLMTGDDPRKNTFGGLAGIAAATSHLVERDVIVVGMAGQDDRVHHWSIAAAMRPGEAKVLGRVDDGPLREVLESAACVVVPTFDEGLSLPVIEASRAGAPVVASTIPAHDELVGRGRFSCDPRDPGSIARAVRRTVGSDSVRRRQAQRLDQLAYQALEDVVASFVVKHRSSSHMADVVPKVSGLEVEKQRMKVAVATPWPPQKTGVGDYSAATLMPLADLVDLTVFTTTDADVPVVSNAGYEIKQRSITEVFADPQAIEREYDAFLSVVGNSHYHLPNVELLGKLGAIVIAHDTRMTEFYAALRGEGGVQELMSKSADHSGSMGLQPPLDDQLADMRLLQNTGFWDIGRRAKQLIVHSPSAMPRIAREIGRDVEVLPFANYRKPDLSLISDADRRDARVRLGLNRFPDETIHLATFGYVDIRTKMVDVVVESAAWLAQWGYPVTLQIVGSASEVEATALYEQAADSSLIHFDITGFQSEERYRDWLLGITAGIQLRISPLLGVSGPLSDLAAYGTPAVASGGLCADVNPPAFVHRLPDAVSPVQVAEALGELIQRPMTSTDVEVARRNYLSDMDPHNYAEQLFEILRKTGT